MYTKYSFTSTTVALRNSFNYVSTDKQINVKDSDHMYICSEDGRLIEMNWNGDIVQSVQIHAIPFSNAQQSFSNLYGTFISFSVSLKMFGIVFSNGLAAIIHLRGKVMHILW